MLEKLRKADFVKYLYYDGQNNTIYVHHRETRGVCIYDLSDGLKFKYFTVYSTGTNEYPTRNEVKTEVMKRVKNPDQKFPEDVLCNKLQQNRDCLECPAYHNCFIARDEYQN